LCGTIIMPKKKSAFSDLLKSFDIDDTLTKEVRKDKTFNRVKNNIPMHANWNQMADLLFLPHTNGYKYALVVVDLATNKFDLQQLKEKTAPAVLAALKVIYSRKYVKKPYASLQTDAGTEFGGVFHKWLYDESIDHKKALPNRHTQMANVESLNKQLGTLIMGYLNKLEEESGDVETDWLPVLSQIREKLNEHRAIDLTKVDYPNDKVFFDPNAAGEPKFGINDVVVQKLDWPEDALGRKQPTAKFRAGDYRFSRVPKKIVKIFYMNDRPFYRYGLEGMNNVSYTESQLKASKETETKYVVKDIIAVRTRNKKREFLVSWKGKKKSESSYEPEANLREDGVGPLLDAFLKRKK
jgi:hypothetical protein